MRGVWLGSGWNFSDLVMIKVGRVVFLNWTCGGCVEIDGVFGCRVGVCFALRYQSGAVGRMGVLM